MAKEDKEMLEALVFIYNMELRAYDKLLEREVKAIENLSYEMEGRELKMKVYKIYVTKYDITLNDYTTFKIIVETEDIFHEIGKIYCTSEEKIKDIRYEEIKK